MKYFLIFLILLSCGGTYYVYTLLDAEQVKNKQAEEKIGELNGTIDDLQAAGKKLTDEKTQLEKNLADEKAKSSDLSTQLDTAQQEATAAQKQAADSAKALADEMAKEKTLEAARAAKMTNYLGTVQTQDGKSYQNCKMLSVDEDGVTVTCETTITKLNYSILPPDLQRKFGYDPQAAAKLSQARIQYLEQQIQAAEAIGN